MDIKEEAKQTRKRVWTEPDEMRLALPPKFFKKENNIPGFVKYTYTYISKNILSFSEGIACMIEKLSLFRRG